VKQNATARKGSQVKLEALKKNPGGKGASAQLTVGEAVKGEKP